MTTHILQKVAIVFSGILLVLLITVVFSLKPQVPIVHAANTVNYNENWQALDGVYPSWASEGDIRYAYGLPAIGSTPTPPLYAFYAVTKWLVTGQVASATYTENWTATDAITTSSNRITYGLPVANSGGAFGGYMAVLKWNVSGTITTP